MADSLHGSIPRIDFAGIGPAAAGASDAKWAAVRAAVMDALCEHGCFEAVMDGLIAPELSAAVLGPGGALETLLSLPVSAKARNTSEKPYRGYVGSVPGLPYESLAIMDPLSPDAVRDFADLMWPGTGNTAFCKSMHAYAEKVALVEAVVRRMVLESVGATAEYIEEQAKATSFKLRLTEYAAPGAAEARVTGLPAHRDTSFLAVLTQNDIDGVEVECGRGEGGWARPALSPGSFLIFAGDTFKVLTNGRVFNPLHRVVMAGDKTRYSSILFSSPNDDVIVRAIDERVDAEHPAAYKPFEYGEYVVFCYTPEMLQHPKKLEAYAAVLVDG
ncbi:putative 2-oxoglutarate-dependent dioxygenase AOP1.2 [Dichanthelium oligosanthes]|uniref:Putative 2-oxoglutarate-dependent dioxygenase AOP1.2 n=1 Tax=Dichanthelium oligosanthes TaxID=888268 RepID=A0A1E5W544_9POAL|nr:putative 2-oxoglutarate-dependent dioxygenase AOP1.2 [Dichanthelium oligosanthes]